MKRAVAIAVVGLVGCASSTGGSPGGDAAPGDGGGDPVDGAVAEPPLRGCTTRFAHAPAGEVTAVELAGEWDWETREPMLDGDGDGTFTIDKPLDPGIWAYKLVVTRPGGAVESASRPSWWPRPPW